MNISGMTVGELRELKVRLEAELVAREKAEREQARTRIIEIALSVGIPLDQLMKNVSKSKGSQKSALAPVYRHPSDAELTSSNRGRQPRWVKEWLDGGGKMDQLAV